MSAQKPDPSEAELLPTIEARSLCGLITVVDTEYGPVEIPAGYDMYRAAKTGWYFTFHADSGGWKSKVSVSPFGAARTARGRWAAHFNPREAMS